MVSSRADYPDALLGDLEYVCRELHYWCIIDAEVKGLCGMYQRVILVPRPDYASRVILWRSMILKNEGQITDVFDLSSLAKITDGYTPGQMHTVTTNVLNERRVQQVCSLKPSVHV